MNFVWQKQSYKRWSARIGPLSIEVRLIGIGDDKYWTVGEVFGSHHHGVARDARWSLEEAEEAAEDVAARLLSQAASAMGRMAADTVGRAGRAPRRVLGGRR